MAVNVKFTGRGGLEHEVMQASKDLSFGQEYEIYAMSIGGSSTAYELVGVEGRFNSVMFEPRTNEVFDLWHCPIDKVGKFYAIKPFENNTIDVVRDIIPFLRKEPERRWDTQCEHT